MIICSDHPSGARYSAPQRLAHLHRPQPRRPSIESAHDLLIHGWQLRRRRARPPPRDHRPQAQQPSSPPTLLVRGETRTYSFEALTKAIRLINASARFIATNPDETGPSPEGVLPATGSVAALITKATGKDPYFVGKPNPLMMRAGLNRIEAHSETSAMIGDRMDTDVLAGLEAGMETVLVLTWLTTTADIDRYPFKPSWVVNSIADLVEEI